jgi:hypothetical protein
MILLYSFICKYVCINIINDQINLWVSHSPTTASLVLIQIVCLRDRHMTDLVPAPTHLAVSLDPLF